jgi:hypothetical protein
MSVEVARANLSEGGFVVIHSTPVVPDNGTAADSVIGNSMYLSPGVHTNVTVTLDEPINETQTLVAMAHQDTNDNQTYDFPGADGPYVDAGGNAIVDSATVTVGEEMEPANFTVSNLSPMDVTVTQGDVITVSAMVTNEGDMNGTQMVEFRVDGTTLANETVTLEGGENTTVEFTGINTSALAPGNYTHGVFTANDSQTATLTVEALFEDPVVSGGAAPMDPDDDGLYEDVNGDGNVTFQDAVDLGVVAALGSASGDLTADQEAAFDFSDDGNFTFQDAVDLGIQISLG